MGKSICRLMYKKWLKSFIEIKYLENCWQFKKIFNVSKNIFKIFIKIKNINCKNLYGLN